MTGKGSTVGSSVLLAVLLVGALIGAAGWLAGGSQSAEDLYQTALLKKEAAGDLNGAIRLFQDVIDKYPGNESIAAKAQFQIGLCYEKLGRTEAVKAYELVVKKYALQKDLVAAARARLVEIRKESPGGLSIIKIGGWSREDMFIQPFEISADGSTCVGVEFLKGQNIVVVDLATSKVRFVTDDTWNMQGYSFAYNPVYSPDGREIAYFSSYTGQSEADAAHSLLVSSLDGKTRVLAKDKNEWCAPMAWLPDGSAILVVKGGMEEADQIGLVRREGGPFRKVASFKSGKRQAGAMETVASVSPDGRYITYTDAAPGEKSDIYIVAAPGGSPEPLLKHPAEDEAPRWSPDGSHIVFKSFRNGSSALWGVAVADGRAAGEPFLIRDGMKDSALLNWTSSGLASWDYMRMRDIYILDVNPATGEPAGEPRQLEYTPTGSNGIPAWSSDGKSFAFIKASPDGGGDFVVFTGNDKKEYRIPAVGGGNSLKWSPDGTAVGAILADKNKEWALYALDTRTGAWSKTPLPVKGITPFDWGKTAEVVIFARNGNLETGGGIFEFNLKTGAQRQLVRPDKDVALVVRWMDTSRDRKKIGFLSIDPQAKGLEARVIDLETGEVRLAFSPFGFFVWSPDGRSFLKRSDQSFSIVPESGGPAKEINLAKRLPPQSTIGPHAWSPDGRRILFTLATASSEVSLFRNVIPPGK
jgi:Tol biopolymer transport system component